MSAAKFKTITQRKHLVFNNKMINYHKKCFPKIAGKQRNKAYLGKDAKDGKCKFLSEV